jgi:hypothetical protein
MPKSLAFADAQANPITSSPAAAIGLLTMAAIVSPAAYSSMPVIAASSDMPACVNHCHSVLAAPVP